MHPKAAWRQDKSHARRTLVFLFEINNKDVDVKTSCPLLSLSPLMRRKIKYIKLISHLVELIEVPTTESLHRLTVVRPHQLEEEDLEVAVPANHHINALLTFN